MKKCFISILLMLLFYNGNSQAISGTINIYSQVTGIAGANVTVASAAGFAGGDRVLIIQMKDATVDLTNTATAGNMICLNQAGAFEFKTISSIAGNVVTLTSGLCRTYNTGNVIQLVRVPVHPAPTITANLTCPAWNGTTGGIVVLETPGILTFNSGINVNGMGFRGGPTNLNTLICNQAGYWYSTASGISAEKGEGVAPPVAGLTAGRGHLANGGGGGNSVNSGGAGGGNFGAGGPGGREWGGGCGGGIANGGVSGEALNPFYSGCERAFLGGAGGGGHSNATEGTAGGNGGGLVIIIANSIVGNGNTISSIGNTALNAAHGGAGGGGAGGSVLLYCANYVGTLNVNVSGGKGGDNQGMIGNPVGPGGGGGGGYLYVSTGGVPANIILTANGGAVGVMQTGGSHFATVGAAGSSMVNLQASCVLACGPPCGVLGMLVTDLDGKKLSPRENEIHWMVRNGERLSRIILQRSDHAGDFKDVHSTFDLTPGKQTFIDKEALPGINYYRLQIEEEDGNRFDAEMISIANERNSVEILSQWPQPVERGEEFFVELFAPEEMNIQLVITDIKGSIISSHSYNLKGGIETVSVSTNGLTAGMYFLKFGEVVKEMMVK